MSEHDRYTKQQNARLAAILKKLIKAEQEAREKHGIQDAFKFIPAQLKELWERLERELPYELEEGESLTGEITMRQLKPGEAPVYIYLYHANGQDLQSFANMLTPKALAELTVTRPIYRAEADVKAFLKNKVHQPFYAYLIAHVNEHEILQPLPRAAQDQNGRPLARLKENVLKPEHIVGLYHNTQGLFVYRNGRLTKIKA